jgi:hypothetical protein
MLQDLSNVNLGYLPVLFVGKLLHCLCNLLFCVCKRTRSPLSGVWMPEDYHTEVDTLHASEEHGVAGIVREER